MPTYVYRCPRCEEEREIFHKMSEIDLPTEDVIRQTSCDGKNCVCKPDGLRWVKIPQVVAFNSFSSLSTPDKTALLKKRATDHYNKEIKERKVELTRKAMRDGKV